MASQGGTSRLAQMQMRFQQKQQQEREQRKIEMTSEVIIKGAGTKIENNEKASLSSSIGPGKVRQMFDERRQRSTGIDKSYPLKPIPQRSSADSTVTRTAITQKQTSSSVRQVTNSRASSTSSLVKESSAIRQRSDILNGNSNNYPSNVFDEDNVDNETFPADIQSIPDSELLGTPLSTKLPNVGKQALLSRNKTKNGVVSGDRNNNATILSQSLKLKPVVTKKTPPAEPTTKKVEKPSITKNDTFIAQNTKQPSPKGKPPTSSPLATKPITKSSPNSRAMNNRSTKEVTTNNSNLPTCRICGRHFNADRLEKHEQICAKAAAKKRKIFDAAKHRIVGTEAEKYVKKSTKGGSKPSMTTNKAATSGVKPSNWRKTHEEFINAIRSAKKMQAHIAKGGKASDLPPPPPSENPDYVQCPHCKRRFNQSAAERHIPKCATFLHNKPKAGASQASRKRF